MVNHTFIVKVPVNTNMPDINGILASIGPPPTATESVNYSFSFPRIINKEDLARRGRELWTEFHTSVDTFEQYQSWKQKIPSYGCKCRQDFAKIEAEFPPVFENGILTFEWKSTIHNAVNRKLNKPEVTLDEARQIWRKGAESNPAT